MNVANGDMLSMEEKIKFNLSVNWYWIVIVLAMVTSIAVLIPENLYPIIYVRYLFTIVLLLFLPGYTFLRALFTISTKPENLGTLERYAFSIGLSLALLSILGLILNYSPWGIRVLPITLGLTSMTIAFALLALLGEHKNKENLHDASGLLSSIKS